MALKIEIFVLYIRFASIFKRDALPKASREERSKSNKLLYIVDILHIYIKCLKLTFSYFILNKTVLVIIILYITKKRLIKANLIS